MPKPNWDKKTISTYITQQQKEVWEKTAISECKQVADFVRDRVESTINNEDYKGKVCVWLHVPKELINKAKKPGEKNKTKNSNPELDELIQNHVQRIVNEDTVKELQWEQSANNPDIETLKAKNLELERQIELLKAENENLRNRATVSESNEIFKVLDREKFLSLEKIAVLLNRGDDDVSIHELQDELEQLMFNVGMIEFKLGNGGGYRYNPDIEPVERSYSGKKLKIEV
jgi:hypothetical protein